MQVGRSTHSSAFVKCKNMGRLKNKCKNKYGFLQ